MDVRIFIEPQQGASYDDQLRIARASEDLGFDGFFRSDHYHVMGSGDGRPGPSDAWVTLAALARETSRIRLGTLVTAATFRHPGPLAISVAQIDQMSGGRVELGLGAGWFEKEHAAYGIPFPELPERFDRFAEQVEVIDGLWTTPVDRPYSFAGKHYRLTDAPGLPKPAQSPRPPIILGGSGKRRSADLAARFADEYNVGFKRAQTAEIFGRVRAAAAGSGRELVYSVAQVVCVGRDPGQLRRRADALGREVGELRENGIAGSPAEAVERIAEFAGYGATRIYLQVLDLADLDQLELIASAVVPQLSG
jgi:F420-dependent oxidoreductase-like protein